MAEDSLVLHAITAGYGASASAEAQLRDVDLTVAAGEIVCILGPNGAGKSTLVRVASGLLAPWSGDVLLLGSPLSGRTRGDVARVLAVVEQTQQIAASFSVRDVVRMGRAPHQGGWMRGTAKDAAIVEDALARCDLRGVAERPASALSGGEQKRVAVARALAQQPKVLILDEPGAFLDVRHQIDLYELLATAVKEHGLACLVVMHDLNVASQFADRVVLLKAGSVVAAGAVSDVMTETTLRATFDTELYCGVNEKNGARFFLPLRRDRPIAQR